MISVVELQHEPPVGRSVIPIADGLYRRQQKASSEPWWWKESKWRPNRLVTCDLSQDSACTDVLGQRKVFRTDHRCSECRIFFHKSWKETSAERSKIKTSNVIFASCVYTVMHQTRVLYYWCVWPHEQHINYSGHGGYSPARGGTKTDCLLWSSDCSLTILTFQGCPMIAMKYLKHTRKGTSSHELPVVRRVVLISMRG